MPPARATSASTRSGIVDEFAHGVPGVNSRRGCGGLDGPGRSTPSAPGCAHAHPGSADEPRSVAAPRAHARGGRPRAWPVGSARRIPFASSSSTVVAGYALLVGLTIAAGLLLTELLVPNRGFEKWDNDINRWLAERRSPGLTDLSWVGSTLAGGLVIPAVVGVLLVVFLLKRTWLLAAFTLFVICVESGSYRATTLVVHRDRPPVHRLEGLPVDGELPLRPHRGDGRALRRPAAPARLARRAPLVLGRSPWRSPSASRCSWAGPGCTAACTT